MNADKGRVGRALRKAVLVVGVVVAWLVAVAVAGAAAPGAAPAMIAASALAVTVFAMSRFIRRVRAPVAPGARPMAAPLRWAVGGVLSAVAVLSALMLMVPLLPGNSGPAADVVHNLEDVSMAEWRKANARSRMATAATWVGRLREDEPPISAEAAHTLAANIVRCIDRAEVSAEEDASVVGAACWLRMEIERRRS